MHSFASATREDTRNDAVRRMFGRAPKQALLVFDPTFAALSLYVAVTAGAGWLRVAALALLGARALVELTAWARPHRWAPALRWLLGIGLVAISGGPRSPMLPFMLIGMVSW